MKSELDSSPPNPGWEHRTTLSKAFSVDGASQPSQTTRPPISTLPLTPEFFFLASSSLRSYSSYLPVYYSSAQPQR